MEAVTGVFSKPKMPKQDTSLIDAQKKKLDEQEAKQKAENERLRAEQNDKLATSRKKRAARDTLLTGLETGVSSKTDLRGTLG